MPHSAALVSLEYGCAFPLAAAWGKDLESVVNAIGVDQLLLVGMSGGAPTSIAYAAHHPERAQRMLLHGSFVRGICVRDLRLGKPSKLMQ
jgi:pimeloyl-ACP methyl ester carboxylesterase